MDKLDLIVIGAGPGGYVAALRGARQGLKTALVDDSPELGGTCLLRGCIPTKSLLQSAHAYELCSRGARTFGVKVEGASYDWAAVQKRKAMVVRKGSLGVSKLMEGAGVTVVTGRGRLDGPGGVVVTGADGETRLEATNIILATGSSVAQPPGLECDGERVLSSDHLLEIDAVPESLMILGAGAVGVEFADVFASFGAKVTLVEMLPQILPLEDPDCGAELAKCLARKRIKVRCGMRAGDVTPEADGVTLTLTPEEGEPEKVTVEKLLVAVGRRPNTADIGLDTVDVVVDARGFVQTDAMMMTGQTGLYAIGDIVATPQLAHTASAEALVAVGHISGEEVRPLDYDLTPSCTYSTPEVASVGLSEPTAIERGHRVGCSTFPMAALTKATVLNEPHGFVKIVRDEDGGRVLGVHIVGAHATDLIAEACVAMDAGVDIERWSRVVHPHPTLSESVMEALNGALGEALHG